MSVFEVAAQAYREALPAMAASTVGGLFAGVVLGGMRAELRAVPGLLVLVPALLATRGNVYGSLGARLSTGLHQGLVEPAFAMDDGLASAVDDRVLAAVTAALANGILASLFASVVAFLTLTTLGDPVAPLPTLLAIALLAGVFSGVALTVAVVSVVFVGFRRGYNPDTLVGPLVTTTGDVFGIAFLLLATRIVLALGGI
ncbi:magnesium transporter [Halorussus litoreus]|uniref:magnesium transporter n=1 Tax=Halorussus litoreus TaxID=1710536 RepID=UPI000E229AEE|nr:magnesium transporter [Halorussus litoreus]